jgi:RHS repeat-associated protein
MSFNLDHIIKEDHYYPFGLSISALSSTAPLSKPNRFKLSGNEEQTEFDLNVYDFNARTYDPALGRFMNIDPMADSRVWINPYNYVQNNPLLRVDPTGLIDWVEKEDGEIYWDENATSQETTKKDEKYLGKNVIVATHNRDENDKEEINTATFDVYLESNKKGSSATIKGNTVPADVEVRDFSTLAEGVYAADFAPRTKKPKELAVFIQQADRKSIELPTTDGGTMDEIFLHPGNPNAETLISEKGKGPQYSQGCQTTCSGPGSAAKHAAFMKTVGKKFKGTYYLRANPKTKKE